MNLHGARPHLAPTRPPDQPRDPLLPPSASSWQPRVLGPWPAPCVPRVCLSAGPPPFQQEAGGQSLTLRPEARL